MKKLNLLVIEGYAMSELRKAFPDKKFYREDDVIFVDFVGDIYFTDSKVIISVYLEETEIILQTPLYQIEVNEFIGVLKKYVKTMEV